MGKLFIDVEEFIDKCFTKRFETFVDKGIITCPVNVIDLDDVDGILLTSKDVDTWIKYNATPGARHDVVKNRCDCLALHYNHRLSDNEQANLRKSFRACLIFALHKFENDNKMMNFDVFANEITTRIDSGAVIGNFFEIPQEPNVNRKLA